MKMIRGLSITAASAAAVVQAWVNKLMIHLCKWNLVILDSQGKKNTVISLSVKNNSAFCLSPAALQLQAVIYTET